MHACIPLVCEAINSPSGGQLLKLLACVCKGTHDKALLKKEFGQTTIEQGTDLGVLKPYYKDQILLTSQGYIVGRVACEYINWVNSGRHLSPPYPPDEFIEGKEVLDLGCGSGRWLWHFQKQAKSVVGLEMQPEIIELGEALARRESIPCPNIRQGSIEKLTSYIAERSVDFVFCRIVLNHVHLAKTLGQISKVLRPDGILWVQITSWTTPYRDLFNSDKGREVRHKIYAAFAILNSIVFITTHRQMSLKSKGRMISAHKPAYPTLKAWKAIVSKTGFSDFHVVQNNVFWARKT